MTESRMLIPMNLARLLATERQEFSGSNDYDQAQYVARTFLRVLIAQQSADVSVKVRT